MKVFPSQIRQAIDAMFPNVNTAQLEFMDDGFCPKLKSISAMFDNMPSELIRVRPEIFCDFIEARASIEHVCSKGPGQRFTKIRDRNILQVFQEVLASCPDSMPPSEPQRLSFISDHALADDLARDIGTINRALETGEWKTATVLAGAAVEAMLLDALSKRSATDYQAHGKGALEKWGLEEYANAAVALAIIKANTKSQIDICRSYRNLIHPGKALRLGMVCNRGTALAAASAMEHVISDLS